MKKTIKQTPVEVYIMLVLALIIMMLLTGKKGNAQCYQPQQTTESGIFTYASANSTNGFFSAEWITGYRFKKISAGVGFNAIANNTQPVLFQTRIGYNITEWLHVYVAGTRIMYSVDDKSRNYNRFTTGFQLHAMKFDSGSMFITAHYTPGFVGGGVGMSYNLVNQKQ